MDATLTTGRLILRPLRLEDAPAIYRGCSNWNIARMTSRIPHPYPEGLAEDWIASHADDRAGSSAYRFGIEHQSELIGVVGLERHGGDGEPFELGYWIGEPWWGCGLATEAVARVVAFAFDELGQDELVAGHFHDNPASGRVLEKNGFRYSGEAREWSNARNCEVAARRFVRYREEGGR